MEQSRVYIHVRHVVYGEDGTEKLKGKGGVYSAWSTGLT